MGRERDGKVCRKCGNECERGIYTALAPQTLRHGGFRARRRVRGHKVATIEEIGTEGGGPKTNPILCDYH